MENKIKRIEEELNSRKALEKELWEKEEAKGTGVKDVDLYDYTQICRVEGEIKALTTVLYILRQN